VIQVSPIKFLTYNPDINFTRSFYPILIINIVFTSWFILLFVLKKLCFKNDPSTLESDKSLLVKSIESIVNRKINFFDQLWRYQFLSTVWLSFVQFYNFTYPTNNVQHETFNTILCITSFVCCLLWPIFVSFYSNRTYYETQYS
jgi:hypothetical protein